MDIFIKKSINIILIIVFTFSFSNAQNSLERQLREIDELRAKLDGLKNSAFWRADFIGRSSPNVCLFVCLFI